MFKLITPAEPFDVTDYASEYFRTSGEDTLVANLVSAAVQYVEAYTGRKLGVQTWETVVSPSGLSSVDLLLPLLSVESITHDGEVWPAEKYVVNEAAGTVRPIEGEAWPGEVTIRFVCGYADLPHSLLAAVLLVAGDLYANREAQQDVALYQNRTVDRLLNAYRVF